MTKLHKKRIVSVFIFLIIALTGCDSSNAQNIAIGKKYTFSEEPNYAATNGNDEIDLTDGKKKTGTRFWQDKSTVGWRDKKEIQIDLDLGTVYSIDGFLINTARSSGAGVEFPASCLVFTSLDNEKFVYHGDLMLSTENTSGGYKANSFRSDEGNSLGRYVKLVVTSKSKFVFLDEIEVYGKESNNKMISSLRSKLTNKSIEKADIDAFIQKTLDESSEIRGQYMQVQSARDFLGDLGEGIGSAVITGSSIGDLKKMQSDIADERIKIQSKVLPSGIIFTPIRDIEALGVFSLQDVITAQNEPIQTVTDVKESSFRYFSLINNSSGEESIEFQGVSEGDEIFEILPVANLNNKSIKDALKPVANKVSLGKGENKMFVVSAHAQNTGGNINVVASNKVITTIPSIGRKQVTNIGEKLHANVWAYLDKPILKDNKQFVVNDLEKSGVDVIVVHAAFIDGYDTKDFSKLKDYLGYFKNLQDKKILLFYNFKGEDRAVRRFGGQNFLDQNWKNNFSQWYRLMQVELAKIGVDAKEIYFYPYDEIKADEVNNFVELVKWGKSSIPDFKTFVTILDEKTYEVGNYADIVQLSLFHIKSAQQIKNDNIWVYDVLDHSRERNSYQDYRLMAWIAYYYDLKGVGFWNYSALQSDEDAKHDRAIDGNIDYSVLYLDEDGAVLSSLRWKHFNQGLEDYKVLKSYESQVGKEQVRKIVKGVIDNPNDSERADEALKSLSEIM